jgi:hypothetical protein
MTQSLGVIPANAGCQVALPNHHVSGHTVCERWAKAQNSISVGVGDPKISIHIKRSGIRIANRAGGRPASALASNVEVWLAELRWRLGR